MVATILPADTPPPPTHIHNPWGGKKIIIQLFSEHGHVAYQINSNHECSNMVANILPADSRPPTP